MERVIVEIVARVIITIKSCCSTEMYRHSSSALMLNTRIVFGSVNSIKTTLKLLPLACPLPSQNWLTRKQLMENRRKIR